MARRLQSPRSATGAKEGLSRDPSETRPQATQPRRPHICAFLSTLSSVRNAHSGTDGFILKLTNNGGIGTNWDSQLWWAQVSSTENNKVRP